MLYMPNWCKIEQFSAFPDPPGIIPKGILLISFQSGLWAKPLTTSCTNPSPEIIMKPEYFSFKLSVDLATSSACPKNG